MRKSDNKNDGFLVAVSGELKKKFQEAFTDMLLYGKSKIHISKKDIDLIEFNKDDFEQEYKRWHR